MSQGSDGHTVSRAAVVALLATMVRWCPASEPPRPAAQHHEAVTPVRVVNVRGVHFFSQAEHSRIVVDLDGTVQYTAGRLSDPERLYLDLSDTRIVRELNNREILVGDAVVRRIRVAQNRDSVTRVVLDLNSAARHTIWVLTDPPRLVVDLTPPSRIEVVQPDPRRKDVLVLASVIRANAAPMPNGAPVGESRSGVAASSSSSQMAQTPAVVDRRPDPFTLRVAEPGPRPKAVPELASEIRAKAAPMPESAPVGESQSGVEASTSSSRVAQTPATADTWGPDPYGNGEKRAARYAGLARNVLLIDFDAETRNNDNVFSNNAHRFGDVSFMLDPHLGFRRQGEHLIFALDYQPDFAIYRQFSELNSLNQGLQYDGDYKFTPHFDLRVRGFLLYRTGIFEPDFNETVLPGLGPPASLNQTVITPVANEFQRDYRFDATYKTSPRTSFTFFGGLLQRDFNHAAVTEDSLVPTDERNAGLQYRYRLGPDSTFGALYLLQDMRFVPGSRLLGHSVIVSFAHQISPTLAVDVFGGPEYTRLHELFASPLGPVTNAVPIFLTGWYWSLGGDLTRRSENTVYQLSAIRQLTDGGGLIGAATNTLFSAAMSRRFSGRWAATWSGGYSRTSSLGPPQFASEIDGEFASFSLERSISNNFSARLGYQFNRQRGSGTRLLQADVDRNLVYFGISYHLGRFPVGR